MPTLLVTSDPDLIDLVRRVCAAAGRELDVVARAEDARARWFSSEVVLVGDDAVLGCLDARLRRRDAVAVVTLGDDATVPWRAVLALGATSVVPLPGGEAILLDLLGRRLDDAVPGRLVGVVPGSGGAGASVLAAALAVAAARADQRTLLVDADPDGPGADLLLGAEERAGARWPDLSDVTAGLAPETLRSALPEAHGVHVLSIDRTASSGIPLVAVPAVLESALRAFDLIVVDLPRSSPALHAAVAPLCRPVLLVATGDVRGATAASRTAASLRGLAPVRLVSRELPGACFDGDALAEWLDLDPAAELRYDSRLVAALDRGDPPGLSARSRLGRVCDDLLAGLVAA